MKHIFYFMEAMLLALLCSLNASGQNNFVPGYFINNSGDTVRCNVNFQDWETSPETVRMRIGDQETRVYYPKDIRAFFVPPDNSWVSMNVPMDCSPFTTVDIYAKKEPRLISDTLVFLQKLVEGKMTLYLHKDKDGKEHFYAVRPGEKPVELLVKKTLGVNDVEGNYSTYISTVNVYKGQLKSMMEDCPSVADRAMQTEYSEHALVKVVEAYNTKCGSPENKTMARNTSKVKLKFGVLAGVDMIGIKFSGDESEDLTQATFPSSFSFTAGGIFQIILPKNLSRVSLNNELTVKPYNLTSDVLTTSNVLLPLTSYENIYNINAIYLKLNTLLRYTFALKKVQPFLDAGISNGFAVKMTTNQKVTTYKSGQVTGETEGPIFDEPEKYEFGAIFGAGANLKKFGAEFRYEWSNGMSPYVTLTGNTNTFYLLLSYTF